jgi:hypothetical protein
VRENRDAKLLEVLSRQARENRLVYVILAECRLILPEAQAPQPDHNVHDGAPKLGVADIITVKVVGARVRAPPLFRGLVVSYALYCSASSRKMVSSSEGCSLMRLGGTSTLPCAGVSIENLNHLPAT